MTFDLEKARALAYRASEFKIWTPPGATGHGSDLNKHREWQAVVEICDKRYPEALDQITDLMQNCNSLRTRAQKAEAEIERLRANNAGLSKAVIDIQEERDLAQAEFRTYHKAWEEQAARIQELEDALRSTIQPGDADKIDTFLRDCMCPDSEGPHDCSMCSEDSIEFCDLLKRVQMASQQLQAEGKIGSSEHFNGTTKMIWQITDERKAALKRLYGLLVIRYKYSYPDETETLRSMLQEAGQ